VAGLPERGRALRRDATFPFPPSRRRTTHHVDPLPECAPPRGYPGDVRDVELEVLGWRREGGETALICCSIAAPAPPRAPDRPSLAGSPGAAARHPRLAGGLAAVACARRAARAAPSARRSSLPPKTEVQISDGSRSRPAGRRSLRWRCGRHCAERQLEDFNDRRVPLRLRALAPAWLRPPGRGRARRRGAGAAAPHGRAAAGSAGSGRITWPCTTPHQPVLSGRLRLRSHPPRALARAGRACADESQRAPRSESTGGCDSRGD
jgi:hypothetical protein